MSVGANLVVVSFQRGHLVVMFDHGESCKGTGEIYPTHSATKINVPSFYQIFVEGGLMTLTWDVFLHFWRVLWECGVICRVITFLYFDQ